MVMIDWLSKMAHFVQLCFGEGQASTEFMAKLLFNHIFKLHSLPKEIVLDRDRRFTSDIAY